MREIKFRAWDGVNDKFWYWSFGDEYGIYEDEFWKHARCNGFPLMQYTGLKDKNGTEIYEGDILNICDGSINGIEWFHKPRAVEYVLNKGFTLPMFLWNKEGEYVNDDSTHWCEVIGNIYENPELLEVKE